MGIQSYKGLRSGVFGEWSLIHVPQVLGKQWPHSRVEHVPPPARFCSAGAVWTWEPWEQLHPPWGMSPRSWAYMRCVLHLPRSLRRRCMCQRPCWILVRSPERWSCPQSQSVSRCTNEKLQYYGTSDIQGKVHASGFFPIPIYSNSFLKGLNPKVDTPLFATSANPLQIYHSLRGKPWPLTGVTSPYRSLGKDH